MRRLTKRQVDVLVAIDLTVLGEENPTLPNLRLWLPGMYASTVLSVVDALERKGKVKTCGDRRFAYLGDPLDFPEIELPDIAPEQVFRVYRA